MFRNIVFSVIMVFLVLPGMSTSIYTQGSEAIVSPEVHTDGTVTFRYRNAHASSVELKGSMAHLPGILGPFSRSAGDIWVRTISSLEPGVYHYTIEVDGNRIIDPANALVRAGLTRGQSSVLLVPGNPPLPWEEHPDIPHGAVIEEKLYSRVLEVFKSCYIYLPPGYSESQINYPVFYLLHGGGDNAGGWIHDGYIDNILDFLIAKGKIQPMIGIFPDGQVPGSGNWRNPEIRARRAALHTEYFLTEIMPFVESRYRIRAAGTHRILAGLSMGASQTFQLALRHPHMFSQIAPLSNGAALDSEPHSLKQIVKENKDAINKYIKNLYIAIGKNDFLLERARNTEAVFKETGINHRYQELPGAHTWKFWMERVVDFLQMFSNAIPN